MTISAAQNKGGAWGIGVTHAHRRLTFPLIADIEASGRGELLKHSKLFKNCIIMRVHTSLMLTN
jgi:hypothetical protein